MYLIISTVNNRINILYVGNDFLNVHFFPYQIVLVGNSTCMLRVSYIRMSTYEFKYKNSGGDDIALIMGILFFLCVFG